MRIFLTGAAGFIGSSIAAGLVRAGHQVTGLVRKPEQVAELGRIGVLGVQGELNDRALLIEQAKAVDAVINAASSDHRGAVEAIIEALAGTNKPFLHTSGSSIAARVAIDDLVLASAGKGVRASVLCNTLIYGHGALPRDSVQLPRLLKQARKSGIVRHVGPGRNIWSNVHIDDVVSLYLLALEKSPAGTFYFVESGEAAFRDMTAAIAQALDLGPAQDWPLPEAIVEWGYEMASYGLGSNSRVRGERARKLLGWRPQGPSVLAWIGKDMLQPPH
eukprot:gene15885-18878_t